MREFAAIDNALQSADNAARLLLKDPSASGETRYTAAWAEVPICDKNRPLLAICERYRIGLQGIGLTASGANSQSTRMFKARADSRLSRELWRTVSAEKRLAAEVEWACELVACLRRWEYVATAHCRVSDTVD